MDWLNFSEVEEKEAYGSPHLHDCPETENALSEDIFTVGRGVVRQLTGPINVLSFRIMLFRPDFLLYQ